ncbi:MAG: response regulator transcription factor [Saccharofermentanales bacterium]
MYEILIVDDEPMVIHGLCRQIDWEAYTLNLAGTAESGESAHEILKARNVDILFTDICMPKMDGLALIQAAKQCNPALRSVVISSHNEFKYVKKALQLGVENYLLKPIDQDELNQTLEKIVDNLKRDSIGAKDNASDLSDFRTNVLDRWVHGAIQDYEFYERAELLDIDLSAQQYQICVIDIVNACSGKQKLAYSGALLHHCRENLPRTFAAECFMDRYDRIVIVLSGSGLLRGIEEFEQFFRKITAFSSGIGLAIFAGISPVSEGVENVASHYAAAVEYLNYRFIDPEADHIFCDAILRDSDEPGCVPLLVQMEKALAEEDRLKLKAMMRDFLASHAEMPMESIRNSIVPFLLMIIRRMIESGHASEMLPDSDTMGFGTLGSLDTAQACARWLEGIIDQSFEVMSKRKTTLHLQVQRTLNIIGKNYHTDLSLKTIAADLKLSPAYLGQLFRDETGKHFSNYLTEVRLNASRVLLLETDLKIMEILYRTGISSQSYFNRVFRKAYGLSPLDFRYQGKCSMEKYEA